MTAWITSSAPKRPNPLDEVFGIRTVDDLLRHYPRSYVEGTTVRGADDEQPPEGEHVTLVDEITDARSRPIRIAPETSYLIVTLGSGRSKVTATFFHPKKWIKDRLTKGARVMLSGEVGYFRGAMQLTHPDFLVLDSADGQEPRQQVAEHDRRRLAGGQRRSIAGGVRAYASTRSIRPARSCRAGTSSTACGRCSRCSTRSPTRCPKRSAPSTVWSPRTRLCAPSTSPKTTPTGGVPASGWRSTRRSGCSGRW